MSDPVLALILIVSFAGAAAIARFFKTLEPDFLGAARPSIITGAIGGILIRLLDRSPTAHFILIGVVLTVAALYVRLMGEESEPSDGMLMGAVSGAAASVPLIVSGDTQLRVFSECLLAGAVAGFGITVAVSHVADKLRQLLLDVATAAAAVGAAYAPTLIAQFGVSDTDIAIGATSLIPLILIMTVLRQWSDLRAELRHEASLGFIDDADVRTTAHPLLRLGRGGWTDAHAHRVFVRVANLIALRKRQQRSRPEAMARLYQLEIIKLRTQLQEMSRIDRLSAARALSSDTIAHD